MSDNQPKSEFNELEYIVWKETKEVIAESRSKNARHMLQALILSNIEKSFKEQLCEASSKGAVTQGKFGITEEIHVAAKCGYPEVPQLGQYYRTLPFSHNQKEGPTPSRAYHRLTPDPIPGGYYMVNQLFGPTKSVVSYEIDRKQSLFVQVPAKVPEKVDQNFLEYRPDDVYVCVCHGNNMHASPFMQNSCWEDHSVNHVKLLLK